VKVCPRCSRRFPDDSAKCPDDGTLLKAEVDPLLGRTLGHRYRLVSRLALGRHTVVYLAQHTAVARLCVVKVLRTRLAQDPAVRRVFLEQARVTSQIVHRNVVQVTDSGEESKRVYEVVEYTPGPSLAELLGAGALPWRDAALFGAQTALGLAAAHQLGIIHGGLHPASLLLTQVGTDGALRPVIKLVGFGRASLHWVGAPRKSTIPPPASPFYAPELLQGRTVPASDLYALGGVLFQAVTGAPPNLDDEDSAVALSSAAGVPRSLGALVERLLVRRPERRPKDAASIAEELTQIASVPVHDGTPGLGHDPTPSRRRRGSAA
jgi:serine/threonine-protein kinase